MARLAAFDMDGTLLMPDHHLGRETIATLSRLRERDITPDIRHGSSCSGNAAYSGDTFTGCLSYYR